MEIIHVTALILSSILVLSSCSTIHVHDNSGKTEARSYIGYVNVVLPENDDGYLLKMKGIGAFGFGGDFSFGYVNLKMAGLYPSCHVVFWSDSEVQEKRIRSMFGVTQGVCIVGQSAINPDTGDKE